MVSIANEELFDLKIVPIVETLWNELGVDDTQRKLEIDSLSDSIRAIYSDFTAKLMSKCQEVRTEIQQIQSNQRNLMKAYGIPEIDINEELTPIQPVNLLSQLEETKRKFFAFKNVLPIGVQKLENLVYISRDLFDSLGIPVEERGEYNELGELDLTRERIERFRVKIEELKTIKEKRNLKIITIRKSINQLIKELNETLNDSDKDLMNNKSFSMKTIDSLQDFKTRLETKKTQRLSELSEMAVQITHLWNLLGISQIERNKFLSNHSNLGDDSIKSCKEEIEKLSEQRDKKLPELIIQQKKEVNDYWNLLHIADESRPRFEPKGSNQNEININEFKFLEAEIIRLKKLTISWHPILEIINQREDIINEYNIMLEETSNSQRLMSRGKGTAQQRMREEKARRRYQVALPRLEKKLYQILSDFKKKNGTDFEWDGKPYIDQLEHVNPNSLPIIKNRRNIFTPVNTKKAIKNDENINIIQKSFSKRNRSPSPILRMK